MKKLVKPRKKQFGMVSLLNSNKETVNSGKGTCSNSGAGTCQNKGNGGTCTNTGEGFCTTTLKDPPPILL
jgi:hypothetical protein